MTLRIYDLGRAKRSAQFVLEDDLPTGEIEAELVRAVKRMKGLASRYFDVDYDPVTGKGVIVVGGFRVVGHVEKLEASHV